MTIAERRQQWDDGLISNSEYITELLGEIAHVNMQVQRTEERLAEEYKR